MGELRFREPLNNPTKGDRFGSRGGRHRGIDYTARQGTSVHASEGGIVVRSSDNDSYGKTVIIDHTPEAGDGERHIYSLYAHLDKAEVTVGQVVEQGKKIGTVGNSGNRSRGPHLHFEIIDTEDSGKMKWHENGSTGYPGDTNRKDPEGYLGHTVELESGEGLNEADIERAVYRMDFELDDNFRLRFLIEGKDQGPVGGREFYIAL